MRRSLINLCTGATMMVVLAALTPSLPGCGSFRFDPQAFFAQNTCNIFNCDTLFFLDQPAAGDDDGTDEVNEEGEEHQH